MTTTRSTKSLSVAVGVLCALVIAATPASAEWFSDLWAGATRTEREDLELEILGVTMTDEVKYSTTYAFGVRVGYWFDSIRWLGVAGEVSYLRPDPDVTMFPVSALVMLRLPLLSSEDFPSGRLQPYLAGGPGIFSVKFAGDLGSDLGGRTSDRTWELGLDARAGVSFLFTKEFGIFAEYRMTRVSPEWDVTILGEDATITTDLVSHYLIGGISFRFDL